MTPDDTAPADTAEHLSETPNLAAALETDRFKRFLDHMPLAIAVSELGRSETTTYANIAFERLIGEAYGKILGESSKILPGLAATSNDSPPLSEAVTTDEDDLGIFQMGNDAHSIWVDAWSNIILDDAGQPTYRLVALADIADRAATDQEKLEHQVQAKDVLLRELQHRVKNSLQMITALIRLEARNLSGNPAK